MAVCATLLVSLEGSMSTKRRRRVPRLELFVFVFAFVASCGGGSGSSSGGPPPGPPPIQEPPAPAITYTGNRQTVVAAQSNAAELALRVFSLRSLVQTVELLWTDAPQAPFSSQDRVSGAVGGTAELRMEVDAAGRGFLEADFQDFSDNPGEVINGLYVQRFRPDANQPGILDYSFAGPGTLEFDDLEISKGSLTVRFLGVVRITGVDSNSFDVNLVVSDNQSGETVYFENCTLQFSEATVNNSLRPALEIAGAVYEQEQGGMMFSSLGPMPDFGYNELAGYFVGGAGGGIEIASGGPVTHVRPISFAFVSIIMDMDGDGTPETARRHSWPELAGDPVVESSVVQGPIANAGNVRVPAPGLPAKVHGLFSHDDDGDWLTFQWRLLSRPPLSTLSIADVSSRPYFEFTPDMPGDYVLSLRVSDGGAASETSVVLRNAPSEPHDDDEPVGGLEVGLPAAVATPLLIDGRSAMNWPYAGSVASWHRGGFGNSSFDATGDPASTWFTVSNEGLNEISFAQNSEFAGASASVASVFLAVGPPVFETAIELAGDANAFDVHALDFDGDGDDDIALRAGRDGAERIMVLLSTPEGLLPGPDVPAGIGEIAHADVDSDGLADFLSAADNGVLLFVQAPDHSLPAPQPIPYPLPTCTLTGGAPDIALDDVNDDGRVDIIAVHPCKDAVVSWVQQANGSFAAPTSVNFPDHRISGAAFGDLNGDGRSDVVATLEAKSTADQSGVSILVSQPDTTLAEGYFVERAGIGAMGGTVGDITNDGRADAVIVNVDEILLFRQQDDGTLVQSAIYSDAGGPAFKQAVSLVDMDGDGSKDVFFCDDGPNERLLLQQPGGSFSHVQGRGCFHLTLPQAELAASLDVNSDGRIDLITATEDARGAVDERALVNVYLQGVHTYPTTVTD